MKKIFLPLLCLFIITSFCACGDSPSPLSSSIDASEPNFSSAVYESSLSSDENDVSSGLSNESSDKNSIPSSLLEPDMGIAIHDDEYVNLVYLGCQRGEYEDEVIFYAVNKTNVELTFQPSSMAVDGENLGYIIGSVNLAPNSKGKVVFQTSESLPTTLPQTITGVISVIDFSNEIIDFSYDISFINTSTTEQPIETSSAVQKENDASTSSEKENANIDDLVALMRLSVEAGFGDDSSSVEYDKSNNIITISVWKDGATDLAQKALNGNKEAIAAWDDIKNTMVTLVNEFSSLTKSSNYPDTHLSLNVLNDTNKDNVLLSIYDGLVLYDVAE